MGSISQLRQQIKEKYRRSSEYIRDILTVVIIVLVGVSSFGLGYLAGEHNKAGKIRVSEQLPGEMSAAAYADKQEESSGQRAKGGKVVASAKATHYHLPWCPGAQQINDANKVYFANQEEAKESGYEPAGNCPGLEE